MFATVLLLSPLLVFLLGRSHGVVTSGKVRSRELATLDSVLKWKMLTITISPLIIEMKRNKTNIKYE